MILMAIFTLMHVETWILSTGRDVMVSLMNVLWMGWTFTNSKLRTMYEREEKRHTSHIAERFIQRGERDTGSNPVGRLDFFRSVAFICIDFRKIYLLIIAGTLSRSQRRWRLSAMLIPNIQLFFTGNSYLKTPLRWYGIVF